MRFKGHLTGLGTEILFATDQVVKEEDEGPLSVTLIHCRDLLPGYSEDMEWSEAKVNYDYFQRLIQLPELGKLEKHATAKRNPPESE